MDAERRQRVRRAGQRPSVTMTSCDVTSCDDGGVFPQGRWDSRSVESRTRLARQAPVTDEVGQTDIDEGVAAIGDPVVTWRVLGRVQANRDGRQAKLGPPRERTLLAILLAHAGEPVSMSTVIEALWDDRPPAYAINVVHRHIGSLRRLVQPDLPFRSQGRWLTSSAGAYRVEVDAEGLDLLHFRDLIRQAHASTDDHRAHALFCDALALWTGPAADGLRSTVVMDSLFSAIDHEFVIAATEAGELAERIGEPDAVIADLERATRISPTDERVHAQLIRCLAAAGRRDEGLAVFREVERMLRGQLGVDAGPALTSAHQDVLRDRVQPASAARASAPEKRYLPVPAQLPGAPKDFVGRQEELRHLEGMLPGRSDPTAIAVVTGLAGVGKTSLAVHFASLVAGSFPDGQLYVDLQGFDPGGSPRSAFDVLGRFLEALGIDAERVPRDLDGRSALWRSVVASRALVIVLDNARDSAQVTPLLPGGSGSLVLVTSRSQLRSLTGSVDRVLPLNLFDPQESATFLLRRLGAARLADGNAATDLHALAAGLPLSLALLAARATHTDHVPLSDVAESVREAGASLDPFLDRADPHSDLRAVLSWSYDALSTGAARLLRFLSLYPGGSVSLDSAAALAGATHAEARGLLDELMEASLLTMDHNHRYMCHDLLDRFALERLAQDDAAERDAAEERLYADSVTRAREAVSRIFPRKLSMDPSELAPPASNEFFSDESAAMAWFAEEFRALVALTLRAEPSSRMSEYVWALGWALEQFLDRHGHWEENLAVQHAALVASGTAGSEVARAISLRAVARAQSNLGRMDAALESIRHALEVIEPSSATHPVLTAEIHRYWAWILTQRGDPASSLEHSMAALELLSPDGPIQYRASALEAVGWNEQLLGDLQSGLAHCLAAEQLLDPTDHRFEKANTWGSIGTIRSQLGQYGLSLAAHRRALEAYRSVRSLLGQAQESRQLAESLIRAGHPAWARMCLVASLEIWDNLSHRGAGVTQARITELDALVG